ncbi:MAG: redox-regulated ATPase YchF [Candidatus Eisenbacteria bacterium]|nr:redox-regulated ATPase YchF [Candidatus Eisenbacteria bacterium]
MSLQMGIVGLPNVGKSTLLNALTRAHAEASNYPFCTIDKNVGAASIDDPLLERLAARLHPKEVLPASIQFVDIAGLVRGASKGEGLGNQFLGHVREVDALVHVVRCFDDGSIVHVEGSIDPVRDVELVETELLLADLDAVERHRRKVEHAAKGNPKKAAADLDALERLAEDLKRATPLRHRSLEAEEAEKVRELSLLSAKPVVFLANVSEDDPRGEGPAVRRLRERVHGEPILPLAIRIEEEMAQLDEPDRLAFLADLGLPAKGLDRLLEISRELLDLITFYTSAHEKLQAWLLPRGTKAPRAAGRIHTDMEKGFIRVEVFQPDDLETFGTRAELHKHGRLRVEGREYEIRDRDICHFLFQPA